MSNGTRSDRSRVPSSHGEGGTRPNITASVRTFKNIQEEDVQWLWYPRLPAGKSTELSGDPEVGKSSITADWVARLTTGVAFPDEIDMEREGPLHCLFICAEDDAGDTIKPRLRTAGADMSRVHILDGFIHEGEEFNRTLDLTNPGHLETLEEIIQELEIRFLVIDPIDAYLGGLNTAQNSNVRGVLTPLNKVLADNQTTLLAIRHLNKDSSKKGIYRPGGSIGFTANARVSMLAMAVPESDTDERAVLCIKNNLAPHPDHLGFTIQPHKDNPRKGVLVWGDEPPDVDLGDLNSADSTGAGASDMDEAKKWLVAMTAHGPVPTQDIMQKAKDDLGLSESTMRRAKKKLKGTPDEIEAKKDGNAWAWSRMNPSQPRRSGDG
jgi:putative DNA primase/helicase